MLGELGGPLTLPGFPAPFAFEYLLHCLLEQHVGKLDFEDPLVDWSKLGAVLWREVAILEPGVEHHVHILVWLVWRKLTVHVVRSVQGVPV